LVYLFEPDWLDYVAIRGVSLFLQKGDLTATFSAMGIIFVAVRSDLVRSRFVRYVMILLLAANMFLTLARAALLAMGVAMALTWVAARRGFLVYPAVLGTVGLVAVFAFGSISNGGRMAQISDQLLSVVDVSASYHYQTDFGETKESDNRFRRALWNSMINQTVQQNQWLMGEGFGYDFMPSFEREYQAGTWGDLRSAHNYYVTVFGRLGLVGFCLFAAITFEIIRLSLRSALQLRRQEERNPQALAYWCCVLALLASGAVGVVLEGPMGAIPFWTMIGLALACKDRLELAQEGTVSNLPGEALLPQWTSPLPLSRPMEVR
jgi:O-antigen ligase